MHWPSVGRDGEMGELTTLLRRGTGGAAVIASPGMGKSLLVRELGLRAVGEGWFVARTTASALKRAPPLSALGHLLPAAGRPASPSARLDWAQEALLAAAGQERLILIADDAHLVDEPSLEVVERLITSGHAPAVATIDATHPVPAPISRLWRAGLATRMDLSPLSRLEVGELLSRALDGSVEHRTVEAVFRLSDGEPLLVREITLGALETGALVRVGDRWSHIGPLADSNRVRDLIEERLAELSPPERGLVELLAVGGPVGVGLVERLTEQETIPRLERRQVIALEDDVRRTDVRLTERLHADCIRATMARTSRRLAARRLASELASTGRRRAADTRLAAALALDAGGEVDVDALVDAAEQANSLQDPVTAERFARAAVAAGAGLEGGLALAESLMAQGEVAGAEALLADPGGSADASGDARVALARARLLLLAHGRPEQALAALDEIEPANPSRQLTGQVDSMRAKCLLAAADLQSAAAVARSVTAREPAPPRDALVVAVAGQALGGRPVEVLAELEHIARFRDPVHATGLPGSPWLAGLRGVCLFLAARGQEAFDLLEREQSRASDLNRPFAAAILGIARALLLSLAGRPVSARHLVDDHRSAIGPGDGPLGQLARIVVAEASALTGDPVRAREVLAGIEGPENEFPSLRALARRTRGSAEAARGDLDAAADAAAESGEQARASGQTSLEALALHDLVRLGRPRDAMARLTALAREGGQSWLVHRFAAHAASAATHDPPGLESAAHAFDAAGAVLWASEAASHAGRAYSAVDRRSDGLRMTRLAAALQRRCEGARTPALTWRPPALTDREYQVARLASQGLKSSDIAHRLVLSVRTVDNHLSRVYAKLGVQGRNELPEALLPMTPAVMDGGASAELAGPG
jgi:DNA-binding CsgD family transcriptional regulator